MAGLTRYTNIWKNCFDNRFINLDISEDRVGNVLSRVRDIPFLPSLQNVVTLFATNNVNKDTHYDIVQGLITIGSVFKNQSSKPNIFIYGILSHDESFSVNSLIINKVNDLLKSKCLVKNFDFINQSNGWTFNNGALAFSLVYSDSLHLVEKYNFKLDKSILKAIDSNSNTNPYKSAVCFNLNECDFPRLPCPATRCKPIYSPLKSVAPFINLFIVCLNHLFKIINFFVHLSYLFVLYPSRCLTVHCISLLLILRLMLILIEFLY